MTRRKKSRLYARDQGGERRWYADLRDLGGGRVALRPPGEARATTDLAIAESLLAEKLKELERSRRTKALLGVAKQSTLKDFARDHLITKAKGEEATDRWLQQAENHLRRAITFLGGDRDLNDIRAVDVKRWIAALRKTDNGRGGTLADSSVRHHLNSLSNLYHGAQEEGYVPPGYNPVAALRIKPTADSKEAAWLEVHEAALLLESARTWKPDPDASALPYAHALIATFLLTGGRKSEVLGLKVSDVSFDRKTVTFRKNVHRRLKTKKSRRVVKLWPQLEEILREHVFGGVTPPDALLFPSPRKPGEILTDVRGALDAIGERADWEPGSIRTKMFRHTYCAAALQLLDGEAPISPYTVGRWLGHGGRALVDRVYGHLGEIRHRSEVVEFRVEQHRKALEGRIERLTAPASTPEA